MPLTKDLHLIKNYVYLYHIDKYLIIPTWPESVTDALSSNFQQSNALSRTAPIFSYINSGPRTMQFQISLHREMLEQVNIDEGGTLKPELDEDYVDAFVREIQSIALPKYVASEKSVEPPMVAVKIGGEIFIKGIVTGGVQVGYSKPIIKDKNGKEKYACVQITFTVSETDPYDAEDVIREGSFRGFTASKLDEGSFNRKTI